MTVCPDKRFCNKVLYYHSGVAQFKALYIKLLQKKSLIYTSKLHKFKKRYLKKEIVSN